MPNITPAGILWGAAALIGIIIIVGLLVKLLPTDEHKDEYRKDAHDPGAPAQPLRPSTLGERRLPQRSVFAASLHDLGKISPGFAIKEAAREVAAEAKEDTEDHDESEDDDEDKTPIVWTDDTRRALALFASSKCAYDNCDETSEEGIFEFAIKMLRHYVRIIGDKKTLVEWNDENKRLLAEFACTKYVNDESQGLEEHFDLAVRMVEEYLKVIKT